MKERLLYLTIGVLVGIVVMQWTAANHPSHAGYVPPSLDGIIAFSNTIVLDENGSAWELENPAFGEFSWTRRAEFDPPVPVSHIKFWAPTILVTTDNSAWRAETDGSWFNMGPWPGAPVPTNSSNLSDIKSKYKEDSQ